MKLAFTAKGKTWDSLVDPRFGRTEYFLFYDEENDELTPYDNSEIGKEIPITIIRNNKEKIVKAKLVQRPEELAQVNHKEEPADINSLGLEVENLNGDFARKNSIEDIDGIIITKIKNDSPASKSDLKVGDIILEINQQVINNVSDYKKITEDLEEKIILLYIKTLDDNYQFVTINLDTELNKTEK